jgi:hypothetical protein
MRQFKIYYTIFSMNRRYTNFLTIEASDQWAAEKIAHEQLEQRKMSFEVGRAEEIEKEEE